MYEPGRSVARIDPISHFYQVFEKKKRSKENKEGGVEKKGKKRKKKKGVGKKNGREKKKRWEWGGEIKKKKGRKMGRERKWEERKP